MKFEPIALVRPVAPASWLGPLACRSVAPRQLLIVLLLVLLAANQLLLQFLGVGPIGALAGLAASGALLLFMLRLPIEEERRISVGCLAGCIILAGLIFALGGEGRLFYANSDWQIRDAVLRDMTLHPWPYAYTGRGSLELLRAPIGMYLIPALLGKLGGTGLAEVALLVQNAVLLGILLALGSLLVETTRARIILLTVMIWFSGMDFVAELMIDPADALDITSHIEPWAWIQFSSHVTQAFWVPQHAIVGWAGALLFLLWVKGRLPLAGFVVPLPFMALWSPLALMGLIPFAGAAGLTMMLQRQLKQRDVPAPALAALVALPALVYLQTAGDTVGFRPFPLQPLKWFQFQLFETLPFILGVALLAKSARSRLLLALSGSWLAIVPFIQVGESVDFMMRASITALAVLAVLVGEAIAGERKDFRADGRLPRMLLMVTCCIGAVTGIHEVARALLFRPTPLTRCDLLRTTIDHVESIGEPGGGSALAGMSTYLAPLTAFPERIRPKDVQQVPLTEGVRCWERPWKVSR
jgi:hypothetical protein